MPVQVSVRRLGGQEWVCTLPRSATIRHLTEMVCDRECVKKSQLQLVSVEGVLCAPDTRLLDLVDCPLLDLLDPKTLKRVHLELVLYAVISSDACSVCEAEHAHQLCGECRLVRYCSKACQRQDWQYHREHCRFGGLIAR